MIRSLTILTALWLWLGAGAALAQDGAGLDFEAWDLVATAAETSVSDAALSDAELDALRTEIVDWRTVFLSGMDANADRISTLESQIEALGPVPADGSGEPETIATRRAALTEQLAQAQSPSRAATEAHNRATGLIAEIDGILRSRSTQLLFEAAPAPINPLNWGTGLASLAAVSAEIAREIRVRTLFDLRQQEIRDGLPLTLGLLAVGLWLITMGRRLTLRATERAGARNSRRLGEALGFAISGSQILLPVLGLALIGRGISLTGILGPLGTAVLTDLVVMFAIIFLTMWLAGRLMPRSEHETTTFRLDRSDGPRARRLMVWIGAVVGLARLAETVAGFPDVTAAARGVIVLPVYLIMGFLFFRFASVLRAERQAQLAEGEVGNLKTRLLQVLIPALQVVGVVGPVLAAAGYLNAAAACMVPTALSLGLFAVALALQVPIRDIYAGLTGKDPDEVAVALLPVLVNFGLALGMLPLLALIWGIRPAQLGEIYARANEGFALGGGRVTPGAILSIVLVFAIGLLVTRLVQGTLKTTVLPRTGMDVGARNALSSGVGYVGIALAALMAINAGGIDLTALAFVLSALSVGIGFGLQNVVSNFVSGIILLIERPISEGDWIEVNGQMGIVKDISVRSTRIETFDKTDVIVPNADFISGTVTNWTRGNNIGRVVVPVGVAYGSDSRRVEEILHEIAAEHPEVTSYPAPGVDFLGFGADSLDFRIRAILRDVNNLGSVRTELNHRIYERFAEEGIEIPFAQRDVWIRNPEVLPGAGETT